jgi:NAD(P)-dependent dehydrogenase (short-subunit alcohol dehydrogenase family)
VARGVVLEGGNVVLVARDEARLAERVAELDALAGRAGAASAFVADAGSQAALSSAAAEAVARFGQLDGWVHAVGSILLKPLSATSEEDFARQLDLNAGSAFRALHAALGPMRKQRGAGRSSSSGRRRPPWGYRTTRRSLRRRPRSSASPARRRWTWRGTASA